MYEKTMTGTQIAKAFALRVASVHQLVPGVYRYVYPHFTKSNYSDIVVLGLSSTNGKYRFVPLRENRYPLGVQEGYLSDAGVAETAYNNFMVPIDAFDSMDGVSVIGDVSQDELKAGMQHVVDRRLAAERMNDEMFMYPYFMTNLSPYHFRY